MVAGEKFKFCVKNFGGVCGREGSIFKFGGGGGGGERGGGKFKFGGGCSGERGGGKFKFGRGVV